MIYFSNISRLVKKYWVIILILLLASLFRLYNISGYMEFLGDQGRDVIIVRRFLTQRDLMFIGPQTSVGNMYLGPWYYYFIAPSLLLFNFNPVGPSIMVALLGIATVWLVWYVTREWFGEKSAIISSFLYAISPVVIKYSGFSWNPNIVPFFSLLSVWLGWRVWQKNEHKKIPLLGFALGMIMSSHYLGLLNFPIIFSLLYLTYKKVEGIQKKNLVKNSVLGLVIFGAMALPLVLFDLKHNGLNLKALVAILGGDTGAIGFNPTTYFQSFVSFFELITTRLIGGKNHLAGVFLSIVIFLGWSWLYVVNRRKNNCHFQAVSLLLRWIILGIAGLALYQSDLVDHYFGFLFPAWFILFGFLISTFLDGKKLLRGLGLVILIVSVVFSIFENPLRYSANNQLLATEKITDFIIEQSGGKGFNLALLAERNYDSPYRYFFDLKKTPIKNLHEEVADQLFVICEDLNVECKPLGNPFWDVAAFGMAKTEQEWLFNNALIFKLVHSQ